MPNYCNNKLYIKGPKHTLHKLLDTHIDNDGNFDFSTIIPCSDNWGTKRNAINTRVYAIIDNLLIIDYDTVWDPSLLVTQGLSDLYTDLTIKHDFVAERNEFCGHLIVKAGKVVEYIHDIDYEEEVNDREGKITKVQQLLIENYINTSIIDYKTLIKKALGNRDIYPEKLKDINYEDAVIIINYINDTQIIV